MFVSMMIASFLTLAPPVENCSAALTSDNCDLVDDWIIDPGCCVGYPPAPCVTLFATHIVYCADPCYPLTANCHAFQEAEGVITETIECSGDCSFFTSCHKPEPIKTYGIIPTICGCE